MIPSRQTVQQICESALWRRQPVTVSAVFICYNQQDFVQAALRSVLAQTYPMDVIVSDDCSTDRTAAMLDTILNAYQGPHRVRIRRGAVNRGVCGNQNVSLELAEGDIIVLFEGDDTSAPDRVEQLVAEFCARKRNVGAIGSALRKMDREGGLGDVVSWPYLEGDAWRLVRSQWSVAGCTLAFRRECFFDMGPICRHLVSGDIALWMRGAFLAGGGLAMIPEPLVCYRRHGSNVSSTIKLRYDSPECLRRCCRALLKNEVAQVVELRKIRRYRDVRGLRNPDIDAAWHSLFRIAHQRAALTLAISRHPRRRWIRPALSALRLAPLRPLALRVLALALCPWARRAYRVLKS